MIGKTASRPASPTPMTEGASKMPPFAYQLMLTLGSFTGPKSFQLTLKCGSFGFGMLRL